MICSPVTGSSASSSSSMASLSDLPHFHSSFPLAIETVHPKTTPASSFSARFPKRDLSASKSYSSVVSSSLSRDWDEIRSGLLSDGVSQSSMPCSCSAKSLPDLGSQYYAMPVGKPMPAGKPSTSGEAGVQEGRRVSDVVSLTKAGQLYAKLGDKALSMFKQSPLNLAAQIGVEEPLKSLQRIFLNKELCVTKLFGKTGNAQDFLMQKLDLLFTFLAQIVAFGIWRPWGKAQVALCAPGCSCTLDPPQFSAPTFLQSTSFDISPTGNRWEDKARIRRMMEERGIKKEPGMSRIEINGKLHSFVANDRNHPQLKEIHKEIDRIHKEMREAGYDPDTRFVLHDLPEAEKQKAIQFHSERLAMALGFISTPPRTSLRIVKNLRICGDCHVATKYMSKLTQREIIMRDAFRFHHFRNGVCSCGDYW